jgi:predicted Zn-ribbon and HTH transcriptional regulator
LLAVLLEGPATARDLSRRVGVREREVLEHLPHLDRSLRHRGCVLRVESAACLECGFRFAERTRYARPGGCPQCRGRRISLPRFQVIARGSRPFEV